MGLTAEAAPLETRIGDVVRNGDDLLGAEDGELLLPATEIFPGQVFVTDGLTISARFRFVYTGSAWRYIDSQIPA